MRNEAAHYLVRVGVLCEARWEADTVNSARGVVIFASGIAIFKNKIAAEGLSVGIPGQVIAIENLFAAFPR